MLLPEGELLNAIMNLAQAIWLLELCGRAVQLPADEADPAKAAQRLVSTAEAAGLIKAASYSPASLQQGHGTAVCSFLDQLTDRALKQEEFEWHMRTQLPAK